MPFIKPLRKNFFFTFVDDISPDGRFISKSKSGILMTSKGLEEQSNFARWAIVVAVGDEVIGFNVGDYVLIEPLKWTQGFMFDQRKIWKSDQDKVLAVADPNETKIADLFNA